MTKRWLVVKRFDAQSQPPGFGGAFRAYLQIDAVTVSAVLDNFCSQTSLAVH
jgi:hypothetical protein